MFLGAQFEGFAKASPISVMMRGIIENAFDPDRIDTVFEQAAQAQYTRELRFSMIAELMTSVVFAMSTSIGAAYKTKQEEITVSRKSVYNKLNGVEPEVSAALVHDSVTRFDAVIREMDATLPSLLPGYRVKILDGNHFAATEHRLVEQRSMAAAPLPGQALVVLEPEVQLATHVIPCEDGHSQERALLDEVLPLVEKGDMWIADRNFCTTKFLCGIVRQGGGFLLRQHGGMTVTPVEDQKYVGRTESGHVYEQLVELTDPESNEPVRLRRISIELDKPIRKGETALHLLSNIPEEDGTALELAELYRKRWKIETLFQELTQALRCEIKTLAYPRAAIFAFCLALIAYNGISVIQASLRAEHGREAVGDGVSTFYVAQEISQVHAGMMIAIPTAEWGVFRDLSIAQLADTLRYLAKHVRLQKYEKSKRGPKKPQPERVQSESPHVATRRILAARKSKSTRK